MVYLILFENNLRDRRTWILESPPPIRGGGTWIAALDRGPGDPCARRNEMTNSFTISRIEERTMKMDDVFNFMFLKYAVAE